MRIFKHFTFIFFFSLCSTIFFSQMANARVAEAPFQEPLPSFYTELLPYIVPSPDQDRAGSCLYMASTGAMEILLNKFRGIENPPVDGDTDLSEIYALKGPLTVRSKSWFENPILKWNGGGALSRDVPFSPLTFWSRSLGRAPRIALPSLSTKKIFEVGDRKDFGVMKESTITDVKRALVEYRSPVLVIYRDAGFREDYGHWDTWHVVVIAGYDDEEEEGGSETCWTVRRSFKGPRSFNHSKLRGLLEKGGGCRDKGVFYVRDSEDPLEKGMRVPAYVLRSYDWLKYLGNHAFVAYLNDRDQAQD